MALTNYRLATSRPKWPDLETLKPATVRMNYDSQSDTLMIDFGGVVRPAYSYPLDEGDFDYVYLRLDGHTDEVVGLYIEDVLAGFLDIHPEYVAALEHAELRGMSRDLVMQLRNIAAERIGSEPTLDAVFDDIARIARITSS